MKEGSRRKLCTNKYCGSRQLFFEMGYHTQTSFVFEAIGIMAYLYSNDVCHMAVDQSGYREVHIMRNIGPQFL